jgi:hypothetical protein
MNVQVAAQASNCFGSGAGATICVRGQSTEGERKGLGAFVRVRVLNGHVALMSLPPPDPKQRCDVDTALSGQLWCARNVYVPAWSAAGAPLTVVAWLNDGSGVWSAPQSVLCNGGGRDPVDCCSGCGSASGALDVAVLRELAYAPALQVTIPDGPSAGLYTARAVSAVTWVLTIGGVDHALLCGGGGPGLVIEGPSFVADATSVACEPFSATFPGAPFGATIDVVVIKA